MRSLHFLARRVVGEGCRVQGSKLEQTISHTLADVLALGQQGGQSMREESECHKRLDLPRRELCVAAHKSNSSALT